MRLFLRRSRLVSAPLPVTMTGVRMGERVLQFDVDDASIGGAIAAAVGISGEAAWVVSDERAAGRARKAAEGAAALADVRIAPRTALPFTDAAFDLVVLHARDGWLASAEPQPREATLREAHRVLRAGGRLVALERGLPTGIGALFRARADSSPYGRAGGTTAALRQAGFSPVRVLGDREGYVYTEGLKR